MGTISESSVTQVFMYCDPDYGFQIMGCMITLRDNKGNFAHRRVFTLLWDAGSKSQENLQHK